MNKKINRPFVLILYGPTGVGKTDVSLAISQYVPAEIINMDMGQFYTPLSVGTAKPNWQSSVVAHHLFDIIDTPINYTVAEYRTIFYRKVHEIIARGNLPIVVGGSGFYLYSLLFSQEVVVPDIDITPFYSHNANLWQKLYAIDSARALKIDKADIYRIRRALGIWHATGRLPSSYRSEYNPCMDYVLIFLERERQELKKRIDDRVIQMLNEGWIEEAEKLMQTSWQPYIEKKNLIGYNEIFHYLSLPNRDNLSFERMVEVIRNKTKQYAKRQHTFWRKLEREIKEEIGYTGTYVGCLETLNLTKININLYIDELLKRLPSYIGKEYE